jgi:hypothetical protein
MARVLILELEKGKPLEDVQHLRNQMLKQEKEQYLKFKAQ